MTKAKSMSILLAAAVFTTPFAASAQFGGLAGLGKKKPAATEQGKPEEKPADAHPNPSAVALAHPHEGAAAEPAGKQPEGARPGPGRKLLGGLSLPGHKLGGLGGIGGGLAGGGHAPAGNATDVFLLGAMKSTKNVMISAALLAQALENRTDLASRKAQIDAISNAQDFGELNGQRGHLEEDMTTLTSRQDLAADLSASYHAGDDHQKKLIATAVANLALGLFRNVQLASAAPGMVSSIAANPLMLRHIGELKTAAALIGMQAKGLGTIGTALPKVMSAMKVKALPEADTTEPEVVDI